MLSGYKTYIVALLFILKGLAGFLLPDSGISADPGQDVMTGLGLAGLRQGVAKGATR